MKTISNKWFADVALTKVSLVAIGLFLAAGSASATVHYVWQSSTGPAPPYTNWATAAATIQQALDAAGAGDEIVVTNGLYGTGGRAVYGTMTNRVAVAKPLTVRSVNGPQFTIIQGHQVPSTTNGDGAIRCVYLTDGATLSGFTLTNGATRAVYYPADRESSGGGVWCESTNALVTNCIVAANSAGYYGGGAYGGTLNNCTLTGNSAADSGGGAFDSTLNNCTLTGNSAYHYGGGAEGCTLNNCTLSGNSAQSGGGTSYSTVHNCTLSGNSAKGYFDATDGYYVGGVGGGAADCTLNNCTLTGNSAYYGGGACSDGEDRCMLSNCTLTGNSAYDGGGACSRGNYHCMLSNCTLSGNWATNGGGACESTLQSCTLTGNSADDSGGGVSGGWLYNCTLTGNSAADSGGGVSGGWLYNCIVYFNTAPDGPNCDLYYSTLNYCCTTPQPTNGAGNISVDPELASASHLSVFSPCRGAGSAAYTSGTDIDGEAWGTPPSIGCDEYHAGAVTGALSVSIVPAYTNVAVGFAVGLTARIEGRTTLSLWDFGDGMWALDQPYATHAWTAAGDYQVALWAFNESQPEGVTARVTVHVVTQPVHYVAWSSAAPAAPYTSWATAATNIQDAVDAATVPGALVLVSNGVYQTGSRYVLGTNRVAVTKPVMVGSVNGPEVTVINGSGAARCLYLASDAVLAGFTLTNGVAEYGGGAYGGTLNNCTLTGNSATDLGGGAYYSTLNNCTLTGNSAAGFFGWGGGGGGRIRACSTIAR